MPPITLARPAKVAPGGKGAGRGLPDQDPGDVIKGLAHDVGRLVLVVALDIGRDGHGEIEVRVVGHDALEAVRRAEMPVGRAERRRLARLVGEVERGEPVRRPRSNGPETLTNLPSTEWNASARSLNRRERMRTGSNASWTS